MKRLLFILLLFSGCVSDRIRPWEAAEIADIRASMPPVRLTIRPPVELSVPIQISVPKVFSRIQGDSTEKAGIIVRRAGADGTIPPPSTLTCDVIYTGSTALSTVSSGINSANDGDVICLERGSTWSSPSGISLSLSHPDTNRVEVCASTGTACSSSGAANPAITITGNGGDGIIIGANVGGYNFRNIDFFATSNNGTSGDGRGLILGNSSRDMTFEGLLFDGFEEAFHFPDQTNSLLPTNIEIGECGGAGHWVEVRGGPSEIGDDRQFEFGGIKNSYLRVYGHNYGPATSGQAATDHWWDIGGQGDKLNASANVTIECGYYLLQAGSGFNALNKFFRVTGLVIRDNVFECETGNCDQYAIAFADHASGNEGVTGSGVACAGANIYRNRFIRMRAVYNQIGEDICIWNNTMHLTGGGGLVLNHYGGAPQVNQTFVANTWAFNNTVYVTGNVTNTFPYLWGNDNPVDRPRCSNCKLFNNLVWIADTGGAGNAYNVVGGTCAEHGADGVNIKNNFVYSPNATPSVLWNTCGSDTGNSTTYNTNPLLVDAPNQDVRPATSSSPPCNFGITSATYPQPADDYDLVARSTPPDVGAFECPP